MGLLVNVPWVIIMNDPWDFNLKTIMPSNGVTARNSRSKTEIISSPVGN